MFSIVDSNTMEPLYVPDEIREVYPKYTPTFNKTRFVNYKLFIQRNASAYIAYLIIIAWLELWICLTIEPKEKRKVEPGQDSDHHFADGIWFMFAMFDFLQAILCSCYLGFVIDHIPKRIRLGQEFSFTLLLSNNENREVISYRNTLLSRARTHTLQMIDMRHSNNQTFEVLGSISYGAYAWLIYQIALNLSSSGRFCIKMDSVFQNHFFFIMFIRFLLPVVLRILTKPLSQFGYNILNTWYKLIAIDHDKTSRLNQMDIWKRKYLKTLQNLDDIQECSICLEGFQPKDQQVLALPCHTKHAFHVHCVENWLWNQETCPICRVRLILDDDLNHPLLSTFENEG